MKHHNWEKLNEEKNNMNGMIYLHKLYECDRCREKSTTLERYLRGEIFVDIYGNTMIYSDNWNGDCDLSIIKQVHNL